MYSEHANGPTNDPIYVNGPTSAYDGVHPHAEFAPSPRHAFPHHDEARKMSKTSRRGNQGPILERIVNHDIFQGFIAFVIVCNAIVMGFETDYPRNPMWSPMENAFLVVFIIELVARICYQGIYFFRSETDFAWNWFDFILVAFGIVDTTWEIVHPISRKKHGAGGSHFTIFRLFRLLRILRIFRLFKMLKQLYILAMGFMEALVAIIWVSLLCALFLYVCGIMLTQQLGRPALARLEVLEEANASESEKRRFDFLVEHFGDIRTSMFTLFKLMAHPNIAEYSSITEKDPYMKVFFILYVIFGSFAMASLLTGIISETMIEKSQMRKEELKMSQANKRNEFLKELKIIFREFDNDCDGCLSREEFQQSMGRIIEALEQGQGVLVREDDLKAVFEMVDLDGSGSIDVDEFMSGISHVQDVVKPVDILELRYGITKCHKELKESMDKSKTNLAIRLAKLENNMDLACGLLQKKLGVSIT